MACWQLVALTSNLIIGLVLAQFAFLYLGEHDHHLFHEIVIFVTLWALSYIMINVGYEFTVDKDNVSVYVWDFLIAMTAAGFPWIFVAVWIMCTIDISVSEAFVIALFAAPTSAGILFSMLDAAGLRSTWLFQKARILAIFDDLGTILLMIPLKVMMVGFKWELLLVVGIMFALLVVGWRKLHSLRLPHTWQWTLLYGAGIAALCHLVHHVTHYYIDMEAIHIEVLLPSFIMGCLVDTPCAHAELQIQRQNSKEMLMRKASSNSIIDGASQTKVEGPSAASTEAAPAASNIAHSSNRFRG